MSVGKDLCSKTEPWTDCIVIIAVVVMLMLISSEGARHVKSEDVLVHRLRKDHGDSFFVCACVNCQQIVTISFYDNSITLCYLLPFDVLLHGQAFGIDKLDGDSFMAQFDVFANALVVIGEEIVGGDSLFIGILCRIVAVLADKYIWRVCERERETGEE